MQILVTHFKSMKIDHNSEKESWLLLRLVENYHKMLEFA
jgi:hypothetical protein